MTATILSSEPVSIESRRDYIDALWWNMHHSYLPGNKAFSLSAYFDDSGSDDLSPMTTLGGPIMSRDAFIEFSDKWGRLLHSHRIPQPLKMTDFVRPYGRHIGMGAEMKLALFADVSRLINKFKLLSMSVSVDSADYNPHLSEQARRAVIGPYGLAFFFAVMANHAYSETSLVHPAEIFSYIIDAGFPYMNQLTTISFSDHKDSQEQGKMLFCWVLDTGR